MRLRGWPLRSRLKRAERLIPLEQDCEMWAWFLGSTSAALIMLNIWGIISPPDYRSGLNSHPQSYEQTISNIDALWIRFGSSKEFIREATKSYNSGIVYWWPKDASVSFKDNWILTLAQYMDPLIRLAGLKNDDEPLFSRFESYRYERALGRGFGICSQNAVGFSDLMHRRYGLDVRPLGLGGHVVALAQLADGSVLTVDPSVSVVLPFGPNKFDSEADAILEVYRRIGNESLGRTYDPDNNFVAQNAGELNYSAAAGWKMEAIRWFEYASDWLMWLIPVAGLAFSAAGALRTRRVIKGAVSLSLIC